MAATVPLKGNSPKVTSKAEPNPFIQFVDENQHATLANMALLCMWLLVRAYEIQRGRKYQKLNMDDIALLKIIKDNATRIWNHHHPGKKVIRLEDCKE
jgi:hypothetical protein